MNRDADTYVYKRPDSWLMDSVVEEKVELEFRLRIFMSPHKFMDVGRGCEITFLMPSWSHRMVFKNMYTHKDTQAHTHTHNQTV